MRAIQGDHHRATTGPLGTGRRHRDKGVPGFYAPRPGRRQQLAAVGARLPRLPDRAGRGTRWRGGGGLFRTFALGRHGRRTTGGVGRRLRAGVDRPCVVPICHGHVGAFGHGRSRVPEAGLERCGLGGSQGGRSDPRRRLQPPISYSQCYEPALRMPGCLLEEEASKRDEVQAPPQSRAASHNPSPTAESAMPMRNRAPPPISSARVRSRAWPPRA